MVKRMHPRLQRTCHAPAPAKTQKNKRERAMRDLAAAFRPGASPPVRHSLAPHHHGSRGSRQDAHEHAGAEPALHRRADEPRRPRFFW